MVAIVCHADEEDGVDDGFFTDYGGNGDVSTFLASEPCVIGKGIDVTDVGVPGETYEERRVRVYMSVWCMTLAWRVTQQF